MSKIRVTVDDVYGNKKLDEFGIKNPVKKKKKGKEESK